MALAVIIGLSAWLASRPIPAEKNPPRGVSLEGVRLTLYPEQDPEARWVFEAGRAEQDPATRQMEIQSMKSGARYLGNKLDLRLYASRVLIDSNDNITTPVARVEILKGCYTVELGEEGSPPVYINQTSGFRAPAVHITSPTLEVKARNFVSDFAIKNPTWGDGKDTFRDGDPQPCTITGGQS